MNLCILAIFPRAAFQSNLVRDLLRYWGIHEISKVQVQVIILFGINGIQVGYKDLV